MCLPLQSIGHRQTALLPLMTRAIGEYPYSDEGFDGPPIHLTHTECGAQSHSEQGKDTAVS